MIPIVPWTLGARPARLAAILERAEGPSPDVLARVAAIIERVRREGDAALVALTRELDQVELAPADLRVPRARLEALAANVDPAVRSALELAAGNIRRFHERQVERGLLIEEPDGVALGWRTTPIEAVGLYVPGGTAAYPSSVLMNAIPARVAGCPRVVAVTPPRALERTPALAAALLLCGVDEVYAVGGAQAVAALAHGTASIPKVDKIVGPGNLWVATAKRLVFGTVGIDSFAGPSEVVVVADEGANPAWVAADLLAQAEHDREAAGIAITWSQHVATRIAAEVEEQLATLPRRETASASVEAFGAVFVVPDANAAVELVDLLAAEHVELVVEKPDALAARIKHAGAIFLGPWAPEAVGDYLAGPNHVLPTAGTARFASALGVSDFVRRTSLIRYSQARLASTGPAIVALARAEGLEAHARSVLVRDAGSASGSDRAGDDTELQRALALVKPQVRALGAYTLPPRVAKVKVDQNENPFELPDAWKREVLARMEAAPWGRYPEFVPRELYAALARFAGWKPDGVLVGNGSNELISVLLTSTVGDGTQVVIPQPTFTLYRSMTIALGGRPIEVPLTADLHFDVDAMLEAGRRGAKVVIVCSPNNPTGTSLSDADLRRLLAGFPGLVVVDEAYHEFAGRSVVPLLADHPRLVVLRTFSKAMALAGLRVGYLMAHPALATELDKVRLPYNLSRFSTIAALLALERHDEVLAPAIRRLIDLRAGLLTAIGVIPGFRPVPSDANFLLVRSAWPPGEVLAALFARGALARDVSRYPGLHDAFRVSVGAEAENSLVVDTLRAFADARGRATAKASARLAAEKSASARLKESPS